MRQKYEWSVRRTWASTKTECRAFKGESVPKKSGSILCEGNRVAQYQFIQKYHKKFGVRWLLRKFSMSPNAYYNYLKARKKECWKRTCRIQKRIITIYHREDGVPGYRQM